MGNPDRVQERVVELNLHRKSKERPFLTPSASENKHGQKYKQKTASKKGAPDQIKKTVTLRPRHCPHAVTRANLDFDQAAIRE